MTPSSLRSPYGRMRCLSIFENLEEWIEVIGGFSDDAFETLAALGRARGVAESRFSDRRHHSVFGDLFEKVQRLVEDLALPFGDDAVRLERDLVAEMARGSVEIRRRFQCDVAIHQERIVHRFRHHSQQLNSLAR